MPIIFTVFRYYTRNTICISYVILIMTCMTMHCFTSENFKFLMLTTPEISPPELIPRTPGILVHVYFIISSVCFNYYCYIFSSCKVVLPDGNIDKFDYYLYCKILTLHHPAARQFCRYYFYYYIGIFYFYRFESQVRICYQYHKLTRPSNFCHHFNLFASLCNSWIFRLIKHFI
jgi:hypothetical protein